MRRQRLRWRLLTALVVLMRGSHAALLRPAPALLRRPLVRALNTRRAPAPAARADSFFPPPGPTSGLRLLNSLTQQIETFVPNSADGSVKWYICGPTVYDDTHVGHARNYIAFDILRRVLSEYFGYDVLYVMNITDIDDKIIVRTWVLHLQSLVAALAAEPKLDAAVAAARATLDANGGKPGLPDLIAAQDALLAAATAAGVEAPSGCDVQSAFLRLTTKFEAEFFGDMEALNVLPPVSRRAIRRAILRNSLTSAPLSLQDAITRVSDYVPEIVAYIEAIQANGFCYEAGGSVYFDTAAFIKSGKKCAPRAPFGPPPPRAAAALPATRAHSSPRPPSAGTGSSTRASSRVSTRRRPPRSPRRVRGRSRRRRRARSGRRRTSCSGRRPRRASRSGVARGARGAPAGTSSARRWRPISSETTSTSTAAGRTSSSREPRHSPPAATLRGRI